MSGIKGTYFDGQTSAGIPVQIKLAEGQLHLNTEAGARIWEVRQIHRNDFNDSDFTVLKYGNYPFEYLEVSETGFIDELKRNYPYNSFSKPRYRLFYKTQNLAVFTILLLGLLAGVYFFLIPQAAEWMASSLPESAENHLGHSLAETLLLNEKTDSVATVQAQLFFNHLAKGKTRAVTVTVIEHQQANAFAVPGGHIVIYKPVIELCDSYPEFAALLAHEYAHVHHRHSLRALFRNLSSYIVLSALFSDVNGIMAVLIENGNMLKSLEFSRKLEQEADRTGLQFLVDRQIDPNGMLNLFYNLKKEQGNNHLPEFISTHPLPDSRIQYLRKEIESQPQNWAQNDSLQFYWLQLKNL